MCEIQEPFNLLAPARPPRQSCCALGVTSSAADAGARVMSGRCADAARTRMRQETLQPVREVGPPRSPRLHPRLLRGGLAGGSQYGGPGDRRTASAADKEEGHP